VDALRDHLDFRLVLMAVFMAAPMAALMRVRQHSWERTGEMAAAMVVPVALVCLPAHVTTLSDDVVAGFSHVLMYVGMLVVMLARFGEYAHAGHHPAGTPAQTAHV
jgi:flagellar biosynthetic protein FliP